MEKVVELRKRTIDILEKTKKDITKYAEERKKLINILWIHYK